ncbi:MAG: class II aldolase/adducin family protein [Oscillospiraceae bacterium]|nr:class II aldolase/adducin family protein [Oscillospiraceae bacterium]
MVYSETEARALVIRAGRRLTESGLIARTWGNISARISDARFVITPSGLAYETLRPEQLVVVNLATCAYNPQEGTPSSEKGIHDDVYRLRPEVQFVIHTHQELASVAGIAGKDLTGCHSALLGDLVPCAGYGMPSTKTLRRAVAAAAVEHPDSPAILMMRHGALCLGRDMEHAFALADALERCCAARVGPDNGQPAAADYGSSTRHGARFCLRLGDGAHWYDVNGTGLPPVAALHAGIYRSGDALCIRHERDAAVTAVSHAGKTLHPYLDDLAQIAGTTVRCAAADSHSTVHRLRGRNAVLLRGEGALCTGANPEDTEAVCLILKKGCRAQLYADTHPGCKPLPRADAELQRLIYTKQYARRKEQSEC